MTIKNVPALKLRFLCNRKWQTSINHVALNTEKLSTNTNKYLNVQCACNEDSSFPCLSSFPSPRQQDYGEGSAWIFFYPVVLLFFLSLKYESLLLYFLMFTLTTVHNDTKQSTQKSTLFTEQITEEWDPSLENGLTFRKSEQSDVPRLNCEIQLPIGFLSNLHKLAPKKSNFRDQIFSPILS